MQVRNSYECFRKMDTNIQDHMCVTLKSPLDFCFGNSGSPLLLTSHSGPILIGIKTNCPTQVETKTYNKNCQNGAPTLFTRITDHLLWIRDQTGVEFFDVFMV